MLRVLAHNPYMNFNQVADEIISIALPLTGTEIKGGEWKAQEKVPTTLRDLHLLRCGKRESSGGGCRRNWFWKDNTIASVFTSRWVYDKWNSWLHSTKTCGAMSVAKRVSEEMETQLGDLVGYAIRFEMETYMFS
ncbi:hypothetical protein Tco_1321115 [Tanacetum coccineum]